MSLTLLDALGDPNLFGPHFKPHRVYGDTWRAWRVFLKALFAHPMDADELATYEACTGRTDLPTEPVSEAALIVGRRGGKSRVLATVAVWLAAFHDYSEYLAPGELASVSVIASDRRQARAIFRYAKGLLEHTELLETMIEDSNSESIILTNRTTIEIQTASFRAVRGSTLIAALCDEVAFWRDETSANPDVEVLRSIRPALGTIPGALLLLASSPYRKAGELYRAYRENYGKADADVLAFRAGTSTMNSSFPQKIIDRAYETDAEAARAEFGAEFRDDLADYVPREVVDRCTVQGRVELPPFPGMQAVAFCDPAGGSGKDSMTLAIAHLQGDMRVLDLVREVKPPFNPASVIADFAAVLRTYGISRVVGDRFGGEWVRQPFRDAGIEYELADRPKSDIYRDALPLLTSGRVELLDVPRLASQLCGLERRTARSGKDSIDHGPGQHDDLSNSVTGALLLAASGATSYQLSSAYLEGLEAITNGMMM